MLTINHVKTPTTVEALTYQCDASSNRVSLNRANAAASLFPAAVSSNSYDAANEQTQFNGVTQTFDANGNLTNDATNTYTWDARNRLTAISGGVTASFSYDGLGRRKSKTIGGTTTGFWYDGNDILAELSSGTPTATYVRGLSIDEPYIRKGTSDEFYEADALGSSVALTNSAGASQTTYTYEPFGNTTQGGTSSSNAFQYTGRENDNTGLYYYRARYYAPTSGRFVAEDPIGLKSGSVNFYNYVGANPLAYVDPLGLEKAVCKEIVWQLREGGKYSMLIGGALMGGGFATTFYATRFVPRWEVVVEERNVFRLNTYRINTLRTVGIVVFGAGAIDFFAGALMYGSAQMIEGAFCK